MIDLRTRQRPREAGVINSNFVLADEQHHTNTGSTKQEDEAREQRIDLLGLRFRGASSSDDRRQIWNELGAEIAARSPEQIRRLEIARGLYREPNHQALQKISIAEHSGRSNSWREPEWEC